MALAYFAPTDTVPKAIPLLNNRIIYDLRVVNGKLYVLSSSGSNFTVETLASIFDIPQTVTSNSDVQGVCIIPASSLWIATASNGLAHLIGSGWKYSYPNGPNSNFFSSLVVDRNGVLWGGSGETAKAGFYKYNPALAESIQWKNFTSDKYPLMRKNGTLFDDYYKVSLGATGSIWASSWGDGVIEVVGDSLTKKYNYNSNPRLPVANMNRSLPMLLAVVLRSIMKEKRGLLIGMSQMAEASFDSIMTRQEHFSTIN